MRKVVREARDCFYRNPTDGCWCRMPAGHEGGCVILHYPETCWRWGRAKDTDYASQRCKDIQTQMRREAAERR